MGLINAYLEPTFKLFIWKVKRSHSLRIPDENGQKALIRVIQTSCCIKNYLKLSFLPSLVNTSRSTSLTRSWEVRLLPSLVKVLVTLFPKSLALISL